MKSKKKPSSCPWCSSRRIAIILGGMPVFIPEMENELDNGGTEMTDSPHAQNGPSWQCTECGAQFFRELQLADNKN